MYVLGMRIDACARECVAWEAASGPAMFHERVHNAWIALRDAHELICAACESMPEE